MILDYDTIILDLDETVWKGCTSDFWAKRLRGALTHCHEDNNEIIYDEAGNYIKLDHDIKPFLNNLVDTHNKTLGFITRGKLLDIPLEKQPSYHALQLFNIFRFFSIKHFLYKTENKGNNILPIGKTIFIDDNQKDLSDVMKKHKNITCLNRNRFDNWVDLYEHVIPA
jgi:predicted phosphatase